MVSQILRYSMALIVLILNAYTMNLFFRIRKGRLYSVIALLLPLAIIMLVASRNRDAATDYFYQRAISGMLYLPLVVYLFDGTLFQKVFGFFLTYIFTFLEFLIANQIAQNIFPNNRSHQILLEFCLFVPLGIAYIALLRKYRSKLLDTLFQGGGPTAWLVYSLGAVFSFFTIIFVGSYPNNPWITPLLYAYILHGFLVLCFAIMGNNTRAKKEKEISFARNLIVSSQRYYIRMVEQERNLQILQHDYKYHLNTIKNLLQQGNDAEARSYLLDVEKGFNQNDSSRYSSNIIINTLLLNYEKRFVDDNIAFGFDVRLPQHLNISEYDLCVIIGNLLENAIEATERLKSNKSINLTINYNDFQLAICVTNSFDGESTMGDDALPKSKKRDGGLGLRSIKAVAEKYHGELIVEWDGEFFSSYVYVQL